MWLRATLWGIDCMKGAEGMRVLCCLHGDIPYRQSCLLQRSGRVICIKSPRTNMFPPPSKLLSFRKSLFLHCIYRQTILARRPRPTISIPPVTFVQAGPCTTMLAPQTLTGTRRILSPSMAPRNLLICFDAFGTLFKPKRPVEQQYAEVARSMGLSGFSDEDVKGAFREGEWLSLPDQVWDGKIEVAFG